MGHPSAGPSWYVVHRAEGSSCPCCEQTVDVLTDREGYHGTPAFYFCWRCRWIGEIGVGAGYAACEWSSAPDKHPELKP